MSMVENTITIESTDIKSVNLSTDGWTASVSVNLKDGSSIYLFDMDVSAKQFGLMQKLFPDNTRWSE